MKWLRTTVVLQDEIYDALVHQFGKRGLSNALNTLLAKVLFKPKKSMFGSLPKMSLKDLEIEDKEFE